MASQKRAKHFLLLTTPRASEVLAINAILSAKANLQEELTFIAFNAEQLPLFQNEDLFASVSAVMKAIDSHDLIHNKMFFKRVSIALFQRHADDINSNPIVLKLNENTDEYLTINRATPSATFAAQTASDGFCITALINTIPFLFNYLGACRNIIHVAVPEHLATPELISNITELVELYFSIANAPRESIGLDKELMKIGASPMSRHGGKSFNPDWIPKLQITTYQESATEETR